MSSGRSRHAVNAYEKHYGNQVASLTESILVSAEPANGNRAPAPVRPPPRPLRPQKITVSATVQAAFQLQ
jgi:hypothetical protein